MSDSFEEAFENIMPERDEPEVAYPDLVTYGNTTHRPEPRKVADAAIKAAFVKHGVEIAQDTPPALHWRDIRNFPGALALSRVPAGLITGFAIIQEQYIAAGALAAVAGYTDYLDGAIARNRGQSSAAGALADVVGDRAYEIPVISALMAQGIISAPLGAVVLASEAAAVVGGAVILKKTGDVREIMPTKEGKFGAAVTFIGGVVLAASEALPDHIRGYANAAGTAIMGLGFLSGIFGRIKLARTKNAASKPNVLLMSKNDTRPEPQ